MDTFPEYSIENVVVGFVTVLLCLIGLILTGTVFNAISSVAPKDNVFYNLMKQQVAVSTLFLLVYGAFYVVVVLFNLTFLLDLISEFGFVTVYLKYVYVLLRVYISIDRLLALSLPLNYASISEKFETIGGLISWITPAIPLMFYGSYKYCEFQYNPYGWFVAPTSSGDMCGASFQTFSYRVQIVTLFAVALCNLLVILFIFSFSKSSNQSALSRKVEIMLAWQTIGESLILCFESAVFVFIGKTLALDGGNMPSKWLIYSIIVLPMIIAYLLDLLIIFAINAKLRKWVMDQVNRKFCKGKVSRISPNNHHDYQLSRF